MIDEIKPNRWQTIVIILIMFIFLFKGELFQSNVWVLDERFITFLVFASLFALPRTWWKPKQIILATIAVSFLIIISLFQQYNQFDIYFMIVLLIPAVYVFKSWGFICYLVILLIEIFLLLTFFGHHEIMQSLAMLILFTGIALSVRARVNRQEAYRLSQLHLKELEKAHKELQQAAVATMQHAILDERTRIAREIHDAVGHSLTSLIVQMQALRYMIETDRIQAKQTVEEMLNVARQGLTDIRFSVHALADDNASLGLSPLEALVSKINATTNLKCTFSADTLAGDIPVATSAVLFKVLQEAITNILKHSQATKVDVNVFLSETECVLNIKDDGLFNETEPLFEGFGLKSMRERVKEIGGIIEFQPVQPSGLGITVKIPILQSDIESKGE